MSDILRCPFCNRNLHKGEDGIYSHLDYMTECKGRLFEGSKELWQSLIRTRKALDIAVGALKIIGDPIPSEDCTCYLCAQTALDQITALEQKD